MTPCLLPLRNLATTVLFLLCHITLALGMPAHHHTTRDGKDGAVGGAQGHNKRAINLGSISSSIAGGAAGLVIFALVVGLGAASIAFFGSVEWAELRGKNKKEAQEGVSQEKGGYDSDSDSIEAYKENVVQQSRREEAVAQEKPRKAKMSRPTLKSFLPMDFNYAWGSSHP